MGKLNIISDPVTDKTETNQKVSMNNIKIALKRALLDFEESKQEAVPGFDVYDFIHSHLNEGYSEPTLRKWVNTFDRHFCEPDQLVAICRLIGNARPAVLLAEYLKAMTEDLI